MRSRIAVRRILHLCAATILTLVLLAGPVLAASRSYSAPKTGGFSSGSRTYSAPKVSVPKSSTRSFSTPKPSTSTSAPTTRSFSTPSPPAYSSPSQSYSTPVAPSYSSGSRGYSSESRSFSNSRPVNPFGNSGPSTPPPAYDTGSTRYPTMPPVVVVGPNSLEPSYWHDYYWGRPWWWRVWHRPVYYGGLGWSISWLGVIVVGVGIWTLLGIISATVFKRRR